MSEQKIKGSGYMAELDLWVEQEIITPLVGVCEEHGPEVAEQVKRAIRSKILESYRNGKEAGLQSALGEQTAQKVETKAYRSYKRTR